MKKRNQSNQKIPYAALYPQFFDGTYTGQYTEDELLKEGVANQLMDRLAQLRQTTYIQQRNEDMFSTVPIHDEVLSKPEQIKPQDVFSPITKSPEKIHDQTINILDFEQCDWSYE